MNEKNITLQIPNEQLNINYQPIYTLPLINEPAPPFRANSTKGEINFPEDYKGKWILLFSYPGDFCDTCTTEILELSKNKELYDKMGVQLVGLSIDSLASHLEWLKSIYNLNYDGYSNTIVDFPIIADSNMDISRLYGLLRRGEKNTETVRGGFLIDPNGKIRAIQIYPQEVGRGGAEIRRLVAATMKAYSENVHTPANWEPGEDVLLPEVYTFDEYLQRQRQNIVDETIDCVDWYLCFKKDNKTTGTMSNHKIIYQHPISSNAKGTSLWNNKK